MTDNSDRDIPAENSDRDTTTEDSDRDTTTEQRPTAEPITPSAPEEFGLVQAFWGDGKGKTTAAMGMGMRAAGHGYRVHMLQFMKGGTASVEDVRGEYNAIAALPGYSYENIGHYGWHAMPDGTEEVDHEAEAKAGLERTRELLDGASAADLTEPFDPESPPEKGVHMLICDEILYAANRDLIAPEAVLELTEDKPENLELVLSGSHGRPAYLEDSADLITHVEKEKHPIDAGQRARKGTEF